MSLLPKSKIDSYPSSGTFIEGGDAVFEGVVTSWTTLNLSAGVYAFINPVFANTNGFLSSIPNSFWSYPTFVQRSYDILKLTNADSNFVLTAQQGLITGNSILTYGQTQSFANDGTYLWAFIDTPTSSSPILAVKSTDGFNWIPVFSSVNTSGYSLGGYYNASFTKKYYVVLNITSLAASTDGVTWTTGTISPTSATAIIANTAITNKFVAIRATGSTISSSTDSVTWTTRTSNMTYIQQIASSNSSSVQAYVIVNGSSGAANMICSSTDGVTWTARTQPLGSTWKYTSVNWLNGAYWATATSTANPPQNDVLTSTDGITWTIKYTYTANYVGEFFSSIGYVNGYYMTAPAWTISTDGNTWLPLCLLQGNTVTPNNGTKSFAYFNGQYFINDTVFYPTYWKIIKYPFTANAP